jgi:hypothetical protein
MGRVGAYRLPVEESGCNLWLNTKPLKKRLGLWYLLKYQVGIPEEDEAILDKFQLEADTSKVELELEDDVWAKVLSRKD